MQSHQLSGHIYSEKQREVYSLRPKVHPKKRPITRSTFYEFKGKTLLTLVFDLEIPRRLTLNLTSISDVLWGTNYILLQRFLDLSKIAIIL